MNRLAITDGGWKRIGRQFELTSRELDVVQLLCIGMRNEGIAGKLRIAKGTVKTHTRNIYRKLRIYGSEEDGKIAMLRMFLGYLLPLNKREQFLTTEGRLCRQVKLSD